MLDASSDHDSSNLTALRMHAVLSTVCHAMHSHTSLRGCWIANTFDVTGGAVRIDPETMRKQLPMLDAHFKED